MAATPEIGQMRQTLADCEAKLGPNHPDVALALLSLAMICDNEEEADAAWLRAAEIFERLGDRRSCVPLSVMASRYGDRGQLAAAEGLYRRLLRLLPDDAESAFAAVQAWIELAVICRRDDRPNDAAESYQQALRRQEQIKDERLRGSPFDHLRALGDCYLDLGRYQDAIETYSRAINVFQLEREGQYALLQCSELFRQLNFALWHGGVKHAEALFGEIAAPIQNAVRIALPYDLVLRQGANLCAITAEFDDAEAMLREALEYYAKSFGTEHDEPKRIELEIAILLRRRGDLNAAETLMDELLLFFESKYGPRNLFVAQVLVELGLVYEAQQRIGEATRAFERVGTMWETLPPEQRQYAGPSYRAAAGFFRRRGDLDRAEALLKSGLENEVEESRYDGRPGLLEELAVVKEDQTQFAEAAKLSEQSAEMIRERMEQIGRISTDVCHDMGIALSLIDKPDKARLYLTVGMVLAELEENVPDRVQAEILINLANIDRDEGQYDEALPRVRRALELFESVDDVTHNEWDFIYFTAADVFVNVGYIDDAEHYALQVINNRRQALGPESPKTARGMLILAKAYSQQKKLAAALQLLEQIDSLLAPAEEEYANLLIESLELRSEILGRLKRSGEARECSARAEKLRDGQAPPANC